MRKKKRRSTGKFDSEFRFVLDLDPALEGWRARAAAYWASLSRTSSSMQAALSAFLVHYLHDQGLHRLSPSAFFALDSALPAPDLALGLAGLSEGVAKKKHDDLSDFLDWVLREQMAEEDADGHWVVPAHLKNPFPRRQSKLHGKSADLEFSHILKLDPKLDDWRQLAAEWLKAQTTAVAQHRKALDKFLILYVYANCSGLLIPDTDLGENHRH